MTTLHIYLTFDGNCEEAFAFYKSIFNREYESFSRFKEMPPQENMPPFTGEMGERVMHVTLPIGEDSVLMGSDTGGDWGPDFKQGNNFSISINAKDKAETTDLFNALSAGGSITMPLDETFWGSYFGMLTDKFGINWMVSCELEGGKS